MKLLYFLFLFSCATKPFFVPEKNPDKIRFCVVGDVGTGTIIQKRVAKAMEEAGCERLVLLGDLIYPDGIRSADDPQLTEKFIRPYRHFPRIYIVLGNHDYYGEPKAWFEIAKKDARIIHPGNFFMEKIRNICLFFLDTNFHHRPDLMDKQRKWMNQVGGECRTKFAFTHHPYHSTGTRHGPAVGAVKEFMEAEIIGKFSALFSGHEHFLHDYGTFNGTRLIISGAGGKTENGYAPGFATFDLNLKSPEKSAIDTVFL